MKTARHFYLSSDTRILPFSQIENSRAEENDAHAYLYLQLQYIRYINHNIYTAVQNKRWIHHDKH